MNDDLGRGMLAWTTDRWQALDKVAVDTVTEHAVMRNFVDQQEKSDATTVRIAGEDIKVKTISTEFDVNMQKDEDEDIDRKVKAAAEELSRLEDKTILDELKSKPLEPNRDVKTKYGELIDAKNQLQVSNVGVVVSSRWLTDLQIEEAGNQSGFDVAERVIGTKILQSGALGSKIENTHAVIIQTTPNAARMVRSSGPRLRALKVDAGSGKVTLRIEEGIAIGTLDQEKCVKLPEKHKERN